MKKLKASDLNTKACRELWTNVILRATADLFLPQHAGVSAPTAAINLQLQHEAAEWILSEDFIDVCKLANMKWQRTRDFIVKRFKENKPPGYMMRGSTDRVFTKRSYGPYKDRRQKN